MSALLQLPFDTLVPLEPSAPEPGLGALVKSKEQGPAANKSAGGAGGHASQSLHCDNQPLALLPYQSKSGQPSAMHAPLLREPGQRQECAALGLTAKSLYADARNARVRDYLDKRAAKENNPLPNGLAPMGPSAGQCPADLVS